jgi:serine protease
MKKLLIGLGLVGTLIACGGNAPAPISGTVSIASGTSGGSAVTAPFVPNEVLVKFKSSLTAQNASSLRVAGATLQNIRALGLENSRLMRASTTDVLGVVQALEARADVLWAQPNFILQKAVVPNDEFFASQWHYPAINLPQAWDIEKGETNPVTVAVIDSGILRQHPDFAGKLLPGFDFISDSQRSKDGNGRDNNPEDSGDETTGQNSYHGSHVAGTVAAATNNTTGVAGVSWGAKILPVRVLGIGGGSLSDILDGMRWSAGLPVVGVPNNPNPAQIINMSLGGGANCSQAPAYQEVIDQINAVGKIIVVAAGNENSDAAGSIPASCSGVITVGATDFANARAPYSNFGARIDVMAPGGDVSKDLNNDQFSDGVLSLGRNDSTQRFNFPFENGTSMAAPHVSGVLALMKSRDPSLTFARALDILTRTARVLTPTKCTGSGTAKTSSDCGAGLIDAQAALQALSVGATPADFSLSLSPSSVRVLPGSSTQITLSILGVGGFNDPVDIAFEGAPTGMSFTLANSVITMNLTSSVPVGTYDITFEGTSGALVRRVSLAVNVQNVAVVAPSIAGTRVLACFYVAVTDECDDAKSKLITISGSGSSSAYTIPDLVSGKYLMAALKDTNADGVLNSGDFIGVYTQNNNLAEVSPPASGIGIAMSLVQTTGSAVSKQQQAVWKFLALR